MFNNVVNVNVAKKQYYFSFISNSIAYNFQLEKNTLFLVLKKFFEKKFFCIKLWIKASFGKLYLGANFFLLYFVYAGI